MSTNDRDFYTERQAFFQRFHNGAPIGDPWHDKAKQFIHNTTRAWFQELSLPDNTKILNAGSGGVDYGISSPMTHYDLIALPKLPNGTFYRGDVEQMPFSNSSFDVVICVGSVLNYCDPTRGIAEISRVLMPNGIAILEYERSESAEFLWRRSYGSSAARHTTFFGEKTTTLWTFSDKFIEGILLLNHFEIERSAWFHCLSALVLGLSFRPKLCVPFAALDDIVTKVPFIRRFASNRILSVRRNHELHSA